LDINVTSAATGAAWPYAMLPEDWRDAILVGRADFGAGPTPIVIRAGRVLDVSPIAPTVSALLDAWPDLDAAGRDLGPLEPALPPEVLLAPIDLQCVKAAGVTFAVSAMERVIEERAGGDAAKALAIREALQDRVGADIRAVAPGSLAAARLKQALIADGLWSQYLEVAIGPDAEIFTKAPVLSSVGTGAEIGIRSDSDWNNPEPEVVLVCDRAGRAVGATLGNDVNLRDFEGRSALLLGKAKDNNASCGIGPLIRLFDDGFTLDDVRSAVVALEIVGPDGFRLSGDSSMALISRDPLDLVRQALSEHQYPDGFVLFLGTMFAPTKDRDVPGRGFTHKLGDVVRVSTPKLGQLENTVVTSKAAAPWTFGIADLMHNLARRDLLNPARVAAAKAS
jgi:fumarylacetoacetate (FAA) hydrolase family protein